MNHINHLLAFLTPYGLYSYWVMFGMLVACGFGLPMPEDIILVTGGILAAQGVSHFSLTVLACFAGVLIGDGIIFLLGRKAGPHIKATWLFRRILTPETDARVMHIFAKFGDKVVFMARFMPGLRMPLFLTSGIYHVPVWKFFTLDGVAALISVPLWIYVGYLFGSNLERLEAIIGRLQLGIYGAMGLLALALISLWMYRRSAARRQPTTPTPKDLNAPASPFIKPQE